MEYIKQVLTVGGKPLEDIKIFRPFSRSGEVVVSGARLKKSDGEVQLYFDNDREKVLCVETNANGAIVDYGIYTDLNTDWAVSQWTMRDVAIYLMENYDAFVYEWEVLYTVM